MMMACLLKKNCILRLWVGYNSSYQTVTAVSQLLAPNYDRNLLRMTSDFRRRMASVCLLSLLPFVITRTGNAQTAAQSKRTGAKNAIVLKQESETPPIIQELTGKYEKYTVQPGDTLFKIARRHMVSTFALQRANGGISRVKPGKTLTLPTLHILPRNPGMGIVMNIPERAVYVFKGGALIGRYPSAIGKSSWQTALGEHKLRNKVKDPSWKPTREMVEREGHSPDEVPPGPNNPLGDRWMGWSEPGFGFHSTIRPASIGQAASHGCVRLYPEAAHQMYEQVSVGMPISSVYEPILIGRRGGRFYMEVFPDVYGTGSVSLARAEKMLEAVGLAPFVDPANLRQIVGEQDGYPHRIAGTNDDLLLNGTEMKFSIAPLLVKDRWIVPVREIVQALGGQITISNGSLVVSGNGRSLTLTTGEKTAKLDDTEIELPFAPTVVQGTTMIPLGPLVQVFGAKVVHANAQTANLITTAAPTSPSVGR